MLYLFKSLIAIVIMFSAGCAYNFPKPNYITSHGFNVFCESEDVCFPQVEIEAATDLLIDELVKQVPEEFTRDRIQVFLDAQYGWHDIKFVSVQEGELGSCPTKAQPQRTCKGFICSQSGTGWCAGLTFTRVIDGFDYTTITLAKFYDCVASNALVHELIHLFHRMARINSDGKHLLEPYWPIACTKEKYPDPTMRQDCMENSINKVSNWKLCQNNCGELCIDAKRN